VSSENDREESDADNDAEPQFGRSQAYKATRVFYRNRRDRQEQETSAKFSSSDSERRSEEISATNGQSRTRPASDTLQRNARISDRSYKVKSNEHLNYNKPVKNKGDVSADTRDRRDKYSREKRSFSTETTTGKQQRRNATNSGHNDNDNDKSKQRSELREASPRVDRHRDDSTPKDGDDAAHADNMRYSRNRRSAGKWKLLQIPAPACRPNRTRPVEQDGPPPADDRRPYRRNLPPRLLAKLQASGASEAVKQNHVDVAICDGGDVQITNTDDSHDASVSQQPGELTDVHASRMQALYIG